MTRSSDDQPTLWLKQVPLNSTFADGVWSDKLLENHRPVARTTERPRQDVDAVTFTQLKAAAEALVRDRYHKDDELMRALNDAIVRFDSKAQKEREQ